MISERSRCFAPEEADLYPPGNDDLYWGASLCSADGLEDLGNSCFVVGTEDRLAGGVDRPILDDWFYPLPRFYRVGVSGKEDWFALVRSHTGDACDQVPVAIERAGRAQFTGE